MIYLGTLRKTLKSIKPPWNKAKPSLWSKAKSVRLFERPDDTTETSRQRLELRQAILKCVVYSALCLITAGWIMLPDFPIIGDLQEGTSILFGHILPATTFALLGFSELMKLKWLFKVLGKKNPP